MRIVTTWPRLALLLTLAACGASHPAASTATPSSAAECTTNDDCTLALYADPTGRAGCCPSSCEHPVVTVREAERVQQSWEATCSTVRCAAPDCENAIDPVPVCQEGRCAARAQ